MQGPEEGTAMRVELIIHLENTDAGETVWWAESPAVPGFSAAAPTLRELRDRATEALRDFLAPDIEVVERLHGVPARSGGLVSATAERPATLPGSDARTVTTDPVPC